MTDKRKWGAFTFEGGNDKFVEETRNYLNEIYHSSRGRFLLDEILHLASSRGCDNLFWTKCYIRFLPGTCDIDRTGATLLNPRISFDPAYIVNTDDFDPTKSKIVAAKKEYVYLIHECIHVLHILNDTYKGSAYTVKPDEEFNTVGLYQYANQVLTENAFRYDMKLPRRPFYYWKTGTKGYTLETEKRKKLNLPPQRQYVRGGKEEQFKKKPPDPPKTPKTSTRDNTTIPMHGHRNRLTDNRSINRDFLQDSRLTGSRKS